MTFKGNKASLPSKPCAACGREMSWRKRWAKTWDEVKYCSDGCRARKSSATQPDPAQAAAKPQAEPGQALAQ